MRRSSSMERAVPILPHIQLSNLNQENPSETTNSPVAKTGDFLSPSTPRSLGFSLSSSSLVSPRSADLYDFSFLSDSDSPGIRLVSSASDIVGARNSAEDEWHNNSDMGSMSVDTDLLIPMARDDNTASLESIEDDCASVSSLDPLNADDSCHSHASHPHLHLYSKTDEHLPTTMHQRSMSADAAHPEDREPEMEPSSSDHGMTMSVGVHETDEAPSNSPDSGHPGDDRLENPGLQYKLVEESSFTSSVEQPRSYASDLEHHHGLLFDADQSIGMYDSPEIPKANLNDSLTTMPGTPWADSILMDRVFEFVDRRVDLPAITEETEHPDLTLPRHRAPPPPSSESCPARPRKGSVEVGVPEPFELAPGTFSSSLTEMDWQKQPGRVSVAQPEHVLQPIHRRVVSDNHVDYNLKRSEELDEMHRNIRRSQENEYAEIRSRQSVGRSGAGDRCHSQLLLNGADLASRDERGRPMLTERNRSMSTSDPALNVDKEPSSGGSSFAASPASPSAPPPVLITRKNSTASPGSWKFFSHGAAVPHNVVTPMTANLNSARLNRTNTVVDSSSSKQDRSRVEKKPKTGSDTFSIGSWFGSNRQAKTAKKGSKSDRPALDGVFNPYVGRGAMPPIMSTASLPQIRSTVDSRPGIPSFDSSGLPDNISRVFSPTGASEADEFVYEKTDFYSSLIENPKWSRLDLFTPEEYQSWHEKYRHDKLNPKAVKKQDAIYELILIEKNHCANLAFLQQGYRARLIEENVLTASEVNALIPDVLDALLVFHCSLLEQLLSRQRETEEVDSISDIIEAQLSDDGPNTAVCVNAYTTFGTAKDKSEQMYNHLKAKNPRFVEFMKRVQQDKIYRKYDFKPIMTKVIGRPTKYGLLLEAIAKYESNKFCASYQLTEKAMQAAKRFAMRIDHNLLVAQMARRWDEVRSHFDSSSQTTLYMADKTAGTGIVKLVWGLDDVCAEVRESGGRRLQCLGDVMWKIPQSGGTHKLQPVFLALFDDIMVCLMRKNNKYQFAMSEQGVLPVASLILRVAGRGHSVMIASGVKPTLLEFEFLSKTDMNKWNKVLEAAIHKAPVVRLSAKNEDEAARQWAREQAIEEKKHRQEEEAWNRRLAEMFDSRREQESQLTDYLRSRLRFMDDVRAHVDALPVRGRAEQLDRFRETLRNKFKELRTARTVPLAKLAEDISRACEADVFSYMDDMADADSWRGSNQPDRVTIGCGSAIGGDSDWSSSDDSGGSGSRSGVKPRRIKTFSGAPTTSGETGSAVTGAREKSVSLRRHTTVPRMSDHREEDERVAEIQNTADVEERQMVEQQVHRLPLTQPLSARRECRRLIKDLSRLKSENIRLTNENAFEKSRLAALERTRFATQPTAMTSPGETMEALRKKEKEVREDEARRRGELDYMEAELAKRIKETEEDFQRRAAELARSEMELAEKWVAIREAEHRLNGGDIGGAINGIGAGASAAGSVVSANGRQRISMSNTPNRSNYTDPKTPPVVQELSPALKSLTLKTETKRKK